MPLSDRVSISHESTHKTDEIPTGTHLHRSTSIVEEVFLGAMLPVLGLSVPSTSWISSPDDQTEKELFYQKSKESHLTGESQIVKPTIKEERRLPECDHITVYANNISVDVNIIQPSLTKNKHFFFRKLYEQLLTFVGLKNTNEIISKRVLFDVTGKFKPYSVVALMGPSGAGKSTLLNVLSRRVHQAEGSVFYNSTLANDVVTRNCSAFVQQLDLFLKNLTVHEQLEYQIKLRLPSNTTKEMCVEREEILCQEMRLIKCKNTVIGTGIDVGGISGGERKRLNVASELTRLPAILYADEPTTGLDSFTAESVMTVLRNLAYSGRTIIATVHQPSSKIFDMFDTIVLLAEGHVIYFGDRLGCVAWLSELGFPCPAFSNPADFIIKVVSTPENEILREKKINQIIHWAERWKQEGEAFLESWNFTGRNQFLSSVRTFTDTQIDITLSNSPPIPSILSTTLSLTKTCISPSLKPSNKQSRDDLSNDLKITDETTLTPLKRLSWWRQVIILYNRATSANKRDKFLIHARAAQTLVLATVFGFLFFRLNWGYQDSIARAGGLYTLLLNQSMAGAFTVTNTFVIDKAIIQREHESGLISASAYMIAKMLADIPVQIIFPIIFVSITYWMMGLNDNFTRFLIIVLLVLLVSSAATSIGYFASAMADSPDTAAIICNLSILPLTIFGGFMVKLDDSPKWLSWIQYISFVKYGFSAGLVAIFRDEKVIVSDSLSVDGLNFIDVLLGINVSNYILPFILLLILLIMYRVISCFAYEYKLRHMTENK